METARQKRVLGGGMVRCDERESEWVFQLSIIETAGYFGHSLSSCYEFQERASTVRVKRRVGSKVGSFCESADDQNQ